MTHRIPEPSYDPLYFQPDRDRYAEHLSTVVPWRTIRITRLHKSVQQVGWAKDMDVRLYVCLPHKLNQDYNLVVKYDDMTMGILQGTRPDFVAYRDEQSMELLAYFSWMGF